MSLCNFWIPFHLSMEYTCVLMSTYTPCLACPCRWRLHLVYPCTHMCVSTIHRYYNTDTWHCKLLYGHYFSGESGAGKTESAKFIISYLSAMSQRSTIGAVDFSVEEAIIQSRWVTHTPCGFTSLLTIITKSEQVVLTSKYSSSVHKFLFKNFCASDIQ